MVLPTIFAASGASRAVPPPPRASPAPTPLVDAVAERGRRAHEAPFHVPGHKRGSAPPPALVPLLGGALAFDLTELEGLDNLAAPEGPIAAAQAAAAAAWGAAATWFLVNGTTVGIHAAVMATCGGDSDAALVLSRNAHLSAFNAAALAGCDVEWAAPATRLDLAHHVTPGALEAAFRRAAARGRRPRAALLVSPTYYGILSDVAALAEVCHRHGAALIVDEAHGAHLRYLDGGAGAGATTGAALQAGADLVVQSTHKQLGALTQGAMLHLGPAAGGRVDAARLGRTLGALQTSSPSYLVMASLDAARAQAQDPVAVAAAGGAAAAVRRWFAEGRGGGGGGSSGPTLRLLTSDLLRAEGLEGAESAGHDPWRLTVLLEGTRRDGWAAAAALERGRGVVAEMATAGAVVFAVGMGSTGAHAAALIAGLEWLLATEQAEWTGGGGGQSLESDRPAPLPPLPPPEVVLTPEQAMYAPSEAVAWGAAAGRVAAELLCPYPPGLPLACPGERLSEDILARARTSGKVVGPADATLATLRVVAE